MTTGFDMLLKGIEMIQAGRRRHAGRLLVDLLRQEPSNEQAWWWLAACVDDKQQKRDCLERLLSLNPNHHDALEALRKLDASSKAKEQNHLTKENRSTPRTANQPNDATFEPAGTGELDLLKMAPRILTAPLKAFDKTAAVYGELLESARAYEVEEDYSDAYDSYTGVLEIDNINTEAWLGRGFSAGMLSSSIQNRMREFHFCMQRSILALEPQGTIAAQAASRMDPAVQRVYLDRLLRLRDYINLLAGRCAPTMANIYLVELVELADWAYHFSQSLSLREGRVFTRADLTSAVIDAHQRIAGNVINTTRGSRARRELLANFQKLLMNNLKLSGLNEDPELSAQMEETQRQVEF